MGGTKDKEEERVSVHSDSGFSLKCLLLAVLRENHRSRPSALPVGPSPVKGRGPRGRGLKGRSGQNRRLPGERRGSATSPTPRDPGGTRRETDFLPGHR